MTIRRIENNNENIQGYNNTRTCSQSKNNSNNRDFDDRRQPCNNVDGHMRNLDLDVDVYTDKDEILSSPSVRVPTKTKINKGNNYNDVNIDINGNGSRGHNDGIIITGGSSSRSKKSRNNDVQQTPMIVHTKDIIFQNKMNDSDSDKTLFDDDNDDDMVGNGNKDNNSSEGALDESRQRKRQRITYTNENINAKTTIATTSSKAATTATFSKQQEKSAKKGTPKEINAKSPIVEDANIAASTAKYNIDKNTQATKAVGALQVNDAFPATLTNRDTAIRNTNFKSTIVATATATPATTPRDTQIEIEEEPIGIVIQNKNSKDDEYDSFPIADSDLEKIDKLVEERVLFLSQSSQEKDGSACEEQQGDCISPPQQPQCREEKRKITRENELPNRNEGSKIGKMLGGDDISQSTADVVEQQQQQQQQQRAHKNSNKRADKVSKKSKCRNNNNIVSHSNGPSSEKDTISEPTGETGTREKKKKSNSKDEFDNPPKNKLSQNSKAPVNDSVVQNTSSNKENANDNVGKGKIQESPSHKSSRTKAPNLPSYSELWQKEEDKLIQLIHHSIADARAQEKKRDNAKKNREGKDKMSKSSSTSSSLNEGNPTLTGPQKGVIGMLSPLFDDKSSNNKKQQNPMKSTANATNSSHTEQNLAVDISKIPKPRNSTAVSSRSSSAASTENNLRLGSSSPSFSSQPRTPILRQTSSHVRSTSSKAGLSLIKNTKLKRLWPDSLVS